MDQQESRAAQPTPADALPDWGPDRPGTSRSLSRHVQQELERLITEGELQPGERLNEVALAKRLGVSRGPVRKRPGRSRRAAS